MLNTNHNPRHWLEDAPRVALLLALILTTALTAACSTTGGNADSLPAVGAAIPPGSTLMVYRDELFNGPNDVRLRNRHALAALKQGDYATAASLFETTLASHPAHPDATYYLGLTRIYQGQTEAGYALLKSYHDPAHYRITKWVKKIAAYLEEKEEAVTPETVHRTLNRYRTDAYNQELLDTRDTREW